MIDEGAYFCYLFIFMKVDFRFRVFVFSLLWTFLYLIRGQDTAEVGFSRWNLSNLASNSLLYQSLLLSISSVSSFPSIIRYVKLQWSGLFGSDIWNALSCCIKGHAFNQHLVLHSQRTFANKDGAYHNLPSPCHSNSSLGYSTKFAASSFAFSQVYP